MKIKRGQSINKTEHKIIINYMRDVYDEYEKGEEIISNGEKYIVEKDYKEFVLVNTGIYNTTIHKQDIERRIK